MALTLNDLINLMRLTLLHSIAYHVQLFFPSTLAHAKEKELTRNTNK